MGVRTKTWPSACGRTAKCAMKAQTKAERRIGITQSTFSQLGKGWSS